MASSAEKLFRLQAKSIEARKKLDTQSKAASKKAGKWSLWGNIGKGLGGLASIAIIGSMAATGGLSGLALAGALGKRALVAGATTYLGAKAGKAAGLTSKVGLKKATGAGAAKKWMKSDLKYKGPLYKGSQKQIRETVSDMYSADLKATRDQSIMAGVLAGATAAAPHLKESKFLKNVMGKAGAGQPPTVALQKIDASSDVLAGAGKVQRLSLMDQVGEKSTDFLAQNTGYQQSEDLQNILIHAKKRRGLPLTGGRYGGG
jgi:hypothetical protein